MQRQTLLLLVVLAFVTCVTSRWLPTRSQEDRLDKLKEMLRELLESEMEKSYSDGRAIFKREIGPSEGLDLRQHTSQPSPPADGNNKHH